MWRPDQEAFTETGGVCTSGSDGGGAVDWDKSLGGGTSR